MFKKIFLLTLVLTLMVSCSAVLAQETIDAEAEVAAEELGVKEPGIFSWAKNLYWDARALITADPVQKAEFKLKKASSQLLRARQLIKNDPNNTRLQERLNDLSENYENLVEDIDTRLEQFQVNNPDDSRLKDFMDKYVAQRLRHQEILQNLEGRAPEMVREQIQEHREEQLEKFGEVMNKLQTNEELKERLQEAIGNVKDDVVRRVNRLEIIEQIEEKAKPMIKSEIKERINEFRQEQPQVIQQLKNAAGEIKIKAQEKAGEIRQNIQEKQQEIKENWEERKDIREEHQEEIQQIQENIQEENQSFLQRIKERLRLQPQAGEGEINQSPESVQGGGSSGQNALDVNSAE